MTAKIILFPVKHHSTRDRLSSDQALNGLVDSIRRIAEGQGRSFDSRACSTIIERMAQILAEAKPIRKP